MTSSLSKSSVFRRPHDYATVSFSKKIPLRRAFWKSFVFGHRLRRIDVDDRRIPNKKVAF